jgi:hypothetical protein
MRCVSALKTGLGCVKRQKSVWDARRMQKLKGGRKKRKRTNGRRERPRRMDPKDVVSVLTDFDAF